MNIGKKMRNMVAGTGMVMFSVFITAIVVYLADWIKLHQRIVLGVACGAGIIAAICCVVWMIARHGSDKPSRTTDAAKNVQKVTAPATSSASIGDINFAPVINVPLIPRDIAGMSQVEIKEEQPRVTSAMDDNLPELELKLSQGKASLGETHFEFSKDGENCITVRVFNRPKSEAARSAVAKQITASIRLSYRSMEATVESSFWVGYDSNQIDLRPGATAHALLFLPTKFSLIMYDNHNAIPARDKEWDATALEPERVDFPIATAVEMFGEIFIISRSHHLSQQVLAHNKFTIEIGDLASLASLKMKML